MHQITRTDKKDQYTPKLWHKVQNILEKGQYYKGKLSVTWETLTETVYVTQNSVC